VKFSTIDPIYQFQNNRSNLWSSRRGNRRSAYAEGMLVRQISRRTSKSKPMKKGLRR